MIMCRGVECESVKSASTVKFSMFSVEVCVAGGERTEVVGRVLKASLENSQNVQFPLEMEFR